MEVIRKYFPELDAKTENHFESLWKLYTYWNERINVISRKDIDNLYLNHVLHSLSIARFTSFVPGSRILDLGCGGGFPGIPLALFFPQVEWTLIDGTKKKIKVCNEVISSLGLKNVRAIHTRAEEYRGSFDFVTSRAVATSDKLMNWSKKFFSKKEKNILPNGLIALKGGDPKRETSLLNASDYFEIKPLDLYFDEPSFEAKYILYVQAC